MNLLECAICGMLLAEQETRTERQQRGAGDAARLVRVTLCADTEGCTRRVRGGFAEVASDCRRRWSD